MSSIEDLVAEVRSFMEEHRLAEYPQALDLDSESGFHVEWENEDWRAFLLLAPTVGSSVVYVGTVEYSADSYMGPEDEEGEGSLPKRGPVFRDARFFEDDDFALVSLIGKEHDGEIISLRIAYVAGGVAHSWTTFARWYEETLSELVEIRERRELVGERVLIGLRDLQERSIREDWATQVAHDRRFFEAQPVPSVRQRITLEILAEFSGLPASDSGLEGVSWSVAAAARHLLPQVKRDLEEEAIERIPELAAELIRRHPDWATLRVGVREKHAKSYLIENVGMNLPLVAEEAARYKD